MELDALVAERKPVRLHEKVLEAQRRSDAARDEAEARRRHALAYLAAYEYRRRTGERPCP